jgi:hypothetical protein
MITERPILFSAQMVQAILRNQKTQSRRVIKPQPEWVNDHLGGRWKFASFAWGWDAQPQPVSTIVYHCPYGQPGDRLWVRETWAQHEIGGETHTFYRADSAPDGDGIRWRPSIFMPRNLSRITLEVTGVRVERVQDIDTHDVPKEGVSAYGGSLAGADAWRATFAELWDSINAKRGHSWESNPFVWVIEFKRIDQ